MIWGSAREDRPPRFGGRGAEAVPQHLDSAPAQGAAQPPAALLITFCNRGKPKETQPAPSHQVLLVLADSADLCSAAWFSQRRKKR